MDFCEDLNPTDVISGDRRADRRYAMRLELRPTGYSWKMMPIPGSTFTNSGTNGTFSGSADCH